MAPARRSSASWALAVVPGVLVAIGSAAIAGLAGRPEAFGSVGVYRACLDASVLLRTFGMFIAVVTVWWELRCRGATRGPLVLAVVSGPIAYAVLAGLQALSAYPPAEAAYYALNPLTIAALGSQTAFAGLVELLWRAAGRGGRWPKRVLSPAPVAAALGGLAVLYVAVLHAGGTTGFFLFSEGYRLLFVR